MFGARRSVPDRRIALALVAVGVGYFLLTAVFVGVHFGLSHDETTYLSQVNPSVPNFDWNAWRAWGMPVLFSPIAVFSPGLAAVRLYACVLTSVCLVLAFWPWLKVLRSYAVPLAALLFSTCWVAVYYGNDVQPNLYVAFGAVAAVGLFVRATTNRSSVWLLAALAFVVFVVALVRPSDGLLVAAPLGLACLVVRPLRRPILLVPLIAGVVGGWLPWIVEAYTRFGGPVHRYHLSNTHDAVGGLHLNVHTIDIYLRMLNGPFYGYTGANFKSLGPLSPIWLAVAATVAALVALGLFVAHRRGFLPPMAMVVADAAMLSLFYVFLLGYGAIRFLLPIIALLTIPAAVALVWLVRRPQRSLALVAGALVFALVSADLALQLHTANNLLVKDRPVRASFWKVGGAIRAKGVRQPCIVFGSVDPTPTAYWARCQAGPESFLPGSLGQPLVKLVTPEIAAGKSVVIVTRAHHLPAYFDSWHKVTLPGIPDPRIHAWISPDVDIRGQ
ncbi:MAG: hypothetical protein ACJ735_15305 [Actinomycetes bacterium]